jgi:Na+-translocating ferredoxin:NAD+ oxidoreductase RnfD subunit
MLVSFLAIASKIIRLKPPKHSFNPAALALIIFSFVFVQPISWWGAAGNFWVTPLLIVLVSPLLIRLKRLTLPLTFLAAYTLYLLVTFQSQVSLTQVLDPTVVFFALVMLTERITSPSHSHWHYSFGTLTGLLLMVLFYFGRFIGHLDPLLLALLLANLAYTVSLLHKPAGTSK